MCVCLCHIEINASQALEASHCWRQFLPGSAHGRIGTQQRESAIRGRRLEEEAEEELEEEAEEAGTSERRRVLERERRHSRPLALLGAHGC